MSGLSRLVGLALAFVLLSSTALAGETEPEKIARLIEELGTNYEAERDSAESALEAIGEPARAALLKASRRVDPEIRTRSRRLLVRMSRDKAWRLIALLGDKEPLKRGAAAKRLTKMLGEGEERFQREATRAALTQATYGGEDWAVRKAAGALIVKADSARISKLIAQLGDESVEKREAASKELLPFGGTAIGQLKKALKSDDPEIRKRSKNLIEQLDERRIGALIEQLGDDSFTNREAASQDLLRLGNPALGLLMKALKSPDLEIRNRAEKLIKQIEANQ